MPRPLRRALVLAFLAAAGVPLGALAAGAALATAYTLRGRWDPYSYGDAVVAVQSVVLWPDGPGQQGGRVAGGGRRGGIAGPTATPEPRS